MSLFTVTNFCGLHKQSQLTKYDRKYNIFKYKMNGDIFFIQVAVNYKQAGMSRNIS